MTAIPDTVENPFAKVDPNKVNADPQGGKSGYSDDDAARIVIQDHQTAKTWLEQYYFTTRWMLADVLYQAPPTFKNWEGSNIPRSFYRPFLVATHVNAIKNKLLGGLFYESEPFKLLSRENADENTIRAVSAVINAQLDMMNFRKEVKLGVHSALLFGTGIWKWDYYTCQKDRWEYERVTKPQEVKTPIPGRSQRIPTAESDQFQKVLVSKTTAYPRLRSVDIRHVFVSPTTRTPDIRDAHPYVIHEMEKTYRDLCELADETYLDEKGVEQKRYKLPSEADFKKWFEPPVDVAQPAGTESYQMNTNFVHHAMPRFQQSTADPLSVPLRVLERWDKGKVITVICGDVSGGYVIRNEANPYGKIPFFSVNWWDISDAFWGIGLGVSLSSDQLLQQGVKNGVIDLVTLSLNGPLLHARGANINTQQLRARLAGFVSADVDGQKVRSLADAIMPMPLPKFPPEAMAILQMSEAETEQTSGASEQLTMGSTPQKGRTSLGRTATGAGGMMAAAEARLAGFVEDFNAQVFQPWLWQMHELNCQFMPMSALRELLNTELGEAFEADEEKFLKSSYDGSIKEFEVLAGSHLAVKQQIAQWLPIGVQYLMNPALQQQLFKLGKYSDIAEVVHMMFDTSGGKNYYSVIKDLTPEMKQSLQDSDPALAKAKAQAAQTQAKQQGKEKLQSQKGTIDLASKLAVINAEKFGEEQLNRAEGEIDRQATEQSGNTEAVTGAPGGPGFGGQPLQ